MTRSFIGLLFLLAWASSCQPEIDFSKAADFAGQYKGELTFMSFDPDSQLLDTLIAQQDSVNINLESEHLLSLSHRYSPNIRMITEAASIKTYTVSIDRQFMGLLPNSDDSLFVAGCEYTDNVFTKADSSTSCNLCLELFHNQDRVVRLIYDAQRR